MDQRRSPEKPQAEPTGRRTPADLRADGGNPADDPNPESSDPGGTPASTKTDENNDEGEEENASVDSPDGVLGSPNLEITSDGTSEPADPKWEKPDLDDIPEFELRTDHPPAPWTADHTSHTAPSDPTAGKPNTARVPGDTRISDNATEGYVVALELCARLPDAIRLPDEAAEIVPAAVEADLEHDIQAFAAAEFDNPHPHVETLSFEEVNGEIWLRLRLGVPPEAFTDLDPDAIRTTALQQLDGIF